MSKLRQNGQDQSEDQGPAQGQNPSMGPSNSQAQGQLDAGDADSGPAASLLDEQDLIVDAFGTALERAAANVTAQGTIAVGGHVMMNTIVPIIQPIAEMQIALMNEGMAPERAIELANCLGGALQRWFEGVVPGQAFAITGTGDGATPAVGLPLTYGVWNDSMPFLPSVELMPMTDNPQAAQAVGAVLQNKFSMWKSTTQIQMTGLELPGAIVQVLPTTTMAGGAWI